MTEEAHVSELRKSAMDNDWHIKQGKGNKSRNRQDLLSHSMDVLQIVYNIQSELELETRFETKDYLSAAFFHDLHKVNEVGGTESMEEEEVEELLSDWGLADEVLEHFSTQEFTDVLRTVHQYHGGYDSGARIRMKSDDDLRVLTHVVRLADGIASEEDLADLYTSGYRDNTEALEVINSNISTEYVLGYHQLSEVKPALGALIHGSVRQTVREEGGIPIASRKDATIYLMPAGFDIELVDAVSEQAVGELNENEIKTNVPDKTRTNLYGIEVDVEIEILTQKDKLSQEGGQDDLGNSYRRIAESISPELEKDDAEEFEVVTGGDTLVELDGEKIRTNVPTTQKGYVIGDAASGLVSTLNSDVELSRIEILENLLEDELDLSDYEGANWRTIESYLARIAGNYYFQNSEKTAEEILEELEERGKDLLETKEDDNVVDELPQYISEVLSFSLYDEEETHLASSILQDEIQTGQNYEETCILCGGKGELKYRTNQHLPYSKSYMARGKTGEATTDDWDPLLCPICFIDQSLMRSFVNRDNVRIDDMQDTLFFKIFPNRYLGTQQVRGLKNQLGDTFAGLRTDAENYLEQTGEIEEASDVLGRDTYESRVTLFDSIDIGGMQSLVSSENYFLVAAEYYVTSDDNPAKQTTLTWLDAIQRSLLFYRFYNLNVELETNPEINVEEPHPDESGVVLRSPPSHISTVFGESIGFEDIDGVLEGMTNMSYSLTLPQYDSDDNLNQIYSEFRRSLYPGSRIFRQAEREWDDDKYGPIQASENYETYLSICTEIDTWKDRTMPEQTTNRIDEVVEAFQISVRGDVSTHMIQDPLRTLMDKILDTKNETKEEVINEAAASIYARVERKWEDPDIYFGYESDEPVAEIIEEGCRTFYDKVYEDMLGGDKIRLADQKEDILDAFYFNVRKRGANQE
jgi:hypothetical protein